MNITDNTEILILGIITGAFSTFAPVVISHGVNAIMSIIKHA